MQPQYSQEEFNNCKSRELLPLKCQYCNNIFLKTKHDIQTALNPKNKHKCNCCSQKCSILFRNKQNGKSPINVICKNCDKQFTKTQAEIRKTNNNFFSKSCAAIYSNKYNNKCSKVSKLELYLQSQLLNMFPNLNIHNNIIVNTIIG